MKSSTFRKLSYLLWAGLLLFVTANPAPVSAATATYAFDALNRLVRAEYSSGTTISYTYDAVGNRIAMITTASSFELAVAVTGGGRVASTPDGIDCDANCTATYSGGSSVTLAATPSAGWHLGGWQGCDSSEAGRCTVEMSRARAVAVAFTRTTQVLTVTPPGTNGRIVGPGIGCGATGVQDCAETFGTGTEVALSATPASGFEIAAWSGCGVVVGDECRVTMAMPRRVGVTFRSLSMPLTVDPVPLNGRITAGAGRSVPGNMPGISCGTDGTGDCEETYTAGTRVTLTAVPSAGHRLGEWIGCESVTSGRCTVQMSQARRVSATFSAVTFPLTVTPAPADGRVIGPGIACAAGGPSDCTESQQAGTTVILAATPNDGFVVNRWTGCQVVSGAVCTVQMVQARNVSVQFTRRPNLLLTVRPAPTNGRVSGEGISCGTGGSGDCVQEHALGMRVTLSATPIAGFEVGSWSGCQEVRGSECTVDVTQARVVSVVFTQATWPLTVSPAPSGGAVTGPGIDCGGGGTLCSRTYGRGATVELSAVAAEGYALLRWTGCPSVRGSRCVVTMTEARTVSAAFEPDVPEAFEARAYAAQPSGGVVAIRLTDNEVLWTTQIDGVPRALALHPDGSQVFAGTSAGRLVVIDPVTHAVIREIVVGGELTALDVLPDGSKIYVAQASGAVVVLDAATFAVLRRVPIAGRPVHVRAHPAGRKVYVLVARSTMAHVIDTTFDALVRSVSIGPASNDLVFNADGTEAISANGGLDCRFGGGYTMLEAQNDVATSIIDLQHGTSGVALLQNGSALFGAPCTGQGGLLALEPGTGDTRAVATDLPPISGVKVTPDGRKAVTLGRAAVGAPISLAVLDLETEAVETSLPLGVFEPGPQSFAVGLVSLATTNERNLLVTKPGTGTGTVTSEPAGIACGAVCSRTFARGTEVRLVATAAPGSRFVGWNVPGCDGSGACTVHLDENVRVAARFELPRALTIARSGSGRVTSEPPGIDCGLDCTEAWPHGITVTLRATPAAGFSFAGWSGGGCSVAPECSVTVTGALAVSARFVPVILTVRRTGNGRVTSDPAGINCGTDCTEAYDLGRVVRLVATPDAGWLFTGWTGACAGMGDCEVTLTGPATATATFVRVQTLTLTVRRTGAGTGTIESDLPGITCGTDCSEGHLTGTRVVLRARPSAGALFAGWSGGGCSGLGDCTVTVTAATTVTASFLRAFPLTVERQGGGSGVVRSAAPGIDCGEDCSELYAAGTNVSLVAQAAAGSVFGGWVGACTGGGTTCSVRMDLARTVTARFERVALPNGPPLANASGPYQGTVGIPVAFDGWLSFDPDGDPLTYVWDFGDGATGAGREVVHTYQAAGTFSLRLTVSDGRGASSMTETIVTVAALDLHVAGGTFTNRGGGGVGTIVAFDPTVGFSFVQSLDVQGPPGWFDGGALPISGYQPPGLAADRALWWDFRVPPSGDYTAEALVSGVRVSTHFTIDATQQLAPPEITEVGTGPNLVTVRWTAPAAARSFLVRINTVPWTGTVTRELVVAGSARSVTFEGVVLAPGTTYQASVFALSHDLRAPADPLTGQINISDHSINFTASTFSGRWDEVGPMRAARTAHTATVLHDGRVLVAGGDGGATPLASAEIYDAAATPFMAASNMVNPRQHHAASLLRDGRVLVTGGLTTNDASAEIFDPRTGQFAETLPMAEGRWRHTSTSLPDGTVLVTGGTVCCDSTRQSAEIYDPISRSWAPAAQLILPRAGHTATSLRDGRVLIVGGLTDAASGARTRTTEIYDPVARSFASGPSMNVPRVHHDAVLLEDGRVLITGGVSDSGPTDTAEIYDPSTGTLNLAGTRLASARAHHSAVLLPNAKVLVVGGEPGTTSTDLFDAATGAFSPGPPLNVARRAAPAVFVPTTGGVLVTGGQLPGDSPVLSSAEQFTSDSIVAARYTGGMQTFVGPPGVSSIRLDVRGAQGGRGDIAGGRGGRTEVTLTVTPGETLYLFVGGAGASVNGPGSGGAGGFNGGGDGGSGAFFGGGGGGASDVRRGSPDLPSRIVVAGGGGGGGIGGNVLGAGGAGGGLLAGAGTDADGGQGGGGGTQATGGAGGASLSEGTSGLPGSSGLAGAGGGCQGNGRGGGGGGGGYYAGGGGGGGCTFGGGGGGGGSSFPADNGAFHTPDAQGGNGLIIITTVQSPL